MSRRLDPSPQPTDEHSLLREQLAEHRRRVLELEATISQVRQQAIIDRRKRLDAEAKVRRLQNQLGIKESDEK